MGEKVINYFDKVYKREATFTEKYDARIAKFGTTDVMPLWVADMDLPTSPAIIDALSARISHPIFGYHRYHDNYILAIKKWMLKQHNWSLKRQEIFPINSIVSALNIAVSTFSKEGESVLIQTPIYPPFMQAVTSQNRKILDNTLVENEGKYEIDFEDFENKAKEAKLFLFCSPHNPTGRVWRKEELHKIALICKKHHVIIIADEVHADLVYHDNKHIPIATLKEAQDSTITLNAPSKTFNVAGIVNAYAICHNKALKNAFLTLFHRYALIQANPLSVQTTIAAYAKSDPWLEELKALFLQNISYIKENKDKIHPIKPLFPEATFLLWLDCRGLGFSDDALNRWFIEEAKLGLNRGSSFGRAGEGFMRLNFAHPHEEIKQAIKQLSIAIKKTIKR